MISKLHATLNQRDHRRLHSPPSRIRLAAAYFPAAALCIAATIWSTALVGADDQPASKTPEKPAAAAEQKPQEAVKAPEGLKPIGGRWYVKEGDRPVYYYKDSDQYLDLFSYHVKDSNKDGIDNVRLSHDNSYLIMRSQGYPNHPTAWIAISNSKAARQVVR